MAGDPTDLCALADAKAWLNITDTTLDAQLARLITAASRFITSWLNRPLLAMVYNEKRNGSGTAAMSLLNPPAFAINSLVADTVTVAPAPDALSAGYSFDEDSICLQPPVGPGRTRRCIG
ncbi:MAG TPA: head-tail connector protein [Candidatus Binataceae bacterium]|nr:head-tail connector protein [Candidatus Binataceae bacterium]